MKAYELGTYHEYGRGMRLFRSSRVIEGIPSGRVSLMCCVLPFRTSIFDNLTFPQHGVSGGNAVAEKLIDFT